MRIRGTHDVLNVGKNWPRCVGDRRCGGRYLGVDVGGFESEFVVC